MNKSKELILLENIEECSESLFGFSNTHALFYSELGLVMQAAEIYDEFEKFRRSLCDYLPLLNYADIDFEEWSNRISQIAITIEEAMYKEDCNIRKDTYMHLKTLNEGCISKEEKKSIDFSKYTKLPNLSSKDAGHLLAGMFYDLSSLMDEINGLLRYPEIRFYEDLYYKVYSICETELFALEQDLIDEIKQYPQRRKIGFLHELRERSINDFRQWLGDEGEFKNAYDEKNKLIDENGIGKCIYNRRKSYFDHFYVDSDDSDTIISVSQRDESFSESIELYDTETEQERGIDEDALIDTYSPILKFISEIKFVNQTLQVFQDNNKCNISELLLLQEERQVNTFIKILFGNVYDYVQTTKNKGNWDFVKFMCEYLGFIRKCSRKDFAESITDFKPELGDSDKLAASMGKCDLTNSLSLEKYPGLKDTDPRKIEGKKIENMFYWLSQMVKG